MALNKRDGEFVGGVGANEIVDTTIPKKKLYILVRNVNLQLNI